jgi:hypothetical protein
MRVWVLSFGAWVLAIITKTREYPKSRLITNIFVLTQDII